MNEICDDVKALAGETEALLDSTANAARKRYDEARKGVSTALEHGRDIYGIARKRALKDGMAVDAVIHDNLYRTVLVCAGVGLILGYLLAGRSKSSGG